MYQPDLQTWVFLCTAGLWLTAGLVLLSQAARVRSSPDFLLGLALLVGGLLTGLQGAPNAGHGPFPFAGIALLVAAFWAFGGRPVDEANGLLPGDLWIKSLGMAAIGGALYFAGAFFGAQPVFHLGLPLRPFELPVAAGLVYLWWCARRLPEDYLTCIRRRETRSLLWAAAGAAAARLFGAGHGDLAACGLLTLGVLPFLLRSMPRHGVDVAVRAGIAAAAVLALLGWTRAHHLVGRQQAVQQAQTAATRLWRHFETLQRPLDEAVEQRVADEARKRYDNRQGAVRNAALGLRAILTVFPPDLAARLDALGVVLDEHSRWAEDTLAAVAEWRAGLGQGSAASDIEARAVSARREAWLVLDRGRETLASLQDGIAACGAGVVADTEELQHVVLALLAALALLTGALLPHYRAERQPVAVDLQPYHPEWEPAEAAAGTGAATNRPERKWSGRVLVVDPDPGHRRTLRGMLEPTGVLVDEAGDEADALRQLEQGGFDLVLLDAQAPELDVARATEALRRRGDETPVVALAAGGDDHQSLRAAGCDEVLRRHADPEELHWTLGRFLIAGD